MESQLKKIVPSICRNCLAYCPILVTVEHGRAVHVSGDPDAPLFEAYTCPKGRALPEQHNDPQRLLKCLKRQADGSFAPLESADAVAEVTRKVEEILARDGPRAVAMYVGTGVVCHPSGPPMARSLFRAIKSSMVFTAASIDKPAANTSTALHGNWVAGAQSFSSSDTWMIIGANPVIAKSNGAPCNNPGQRLKEAVGRGMKLIVIDPRSTETARRAHVHLQALPGEDPTLLAGIINILIREDLYDHAFVSENARGFETLRTAVAPYTAEYVTQRAGVPLATLLDAARTFGRASRGGVICSTGPSFSTHSNLTYYLALCLNTLCGRWARAGDSATYPNVLLPAYAPKAQAYPPYPVFGELAMRVHGLRENASGLPAAALADEILKGGEGQIKALFCLGGNPMLAWPDQAKTEAALKQLELLVVFDYRMTPTAELADYIIASPLTLEVPGVTHKVESLKYIGVSRGYEVPFAQYTPKVVEQPAGSDLMDDWEFFYRMAQRMELQLDWINVHGLGKHVESPPDSMKFDMTRVPTGDELIELACLNSRIALDEVKKYPHGHVFDQANLLIAPRDPDHTARLELGDALMMDELRQLCIETRLARDEYPYLLVCRRANNFMNSVGQGEHLYAPACMNSADLQALAVEAGNIIRITSCHGTMYARVAIDDGLRAGVISVSHGFGMRVRDGQHDPHHGAHSVTRLINMDEVDPISGIPRMSAIPVAVARDTAASA
jgi:anaerobic selenocysteine-containing dehydrogenase